MTKYRIFGPPGSGKTTWIVNKIKELTDNGTSINKIACLSFTNQTVNEFVGRFKKINKDNFKYFSTIHSLGNSFRTDKKEIFSEEHYKFFKSYTEREIELYYFVYTLLRENSSYLDTIEYDAYELDNFISKFEEIKEEKNLVDFYDLLKYFDHSIDIDYLFVDESQDLSTAQLLFIDKLIQQTKKDVFIILDDAQAIFNWSGANVDYILSKEDFQDIVLPKTYRLPKKHFELASKILTDLDIDRYKNLQLENQNDGNIESVYSLDDIDFNNKENYLILVRNKYQYKKIYEWCYDNGFRIMIEGTPKYSNKIIDHVKENFIENKKLTVNIERDDYDYIVQNYIENDKPTVNISTIHKAKGSECENVIVFLELTKDQWKQLYLEDSKEELKVLYVASTRSKNNLFFVDTNKRGYDIEQYF